MILQVTGTYTSATSYELFNIKGKAGANFEIGPEAGSAGGVLQGLTIGCYAAGTTTIAPWLTFTNAGAATFTGAVTFGSTARLKNYTVATLPAGVQGHKAFVTDALAPTYLVAVVGGGAVVTEVFYNGTNWVCT